jgi:hypothetical protein
MATLEENRRMFRNWWTELDARPVYIEVSASSDGRNRSHRRRASAVTMVAAAPIFDTRRPVSEARKQRR